MDYAKFIIAPCRSGSTALLKALGGNPQIAAVSQSIKNSVKATGKPDYSIFKRMVPEGKILVNKESLGFTEELSRYELFPDTHSITRSDPVFLFRNPVHTYNSWRKQDWGNMQLFLLAYERAVNLLVQAQCADSGRVIIYEQLAADPILMLDELCKYWGVPFHPHMVLWPSEAGDEDGVEWGADFYRHRELGTHNTLINSRAFELKPAQLILSVSEVGSVEKALMPIYSHLCDVARGTWLTA